MRLGNAGKKLRELIGLDELNPFGWKIAWDFVKVATEAAFFFAITLYFHYMKNSQQQNTLVMSTWSAFFLQILPHE